MYKQITLQKKFSKEFGKKKYAGVNETSRLFKSNNVALKSLDYGHVSALSLESARNSMRKSLKKNMSVLIRIYPYMSLTEKPQEVRMGHGKGGRFRGWYAFVRPGDILFELENCDKELALSILQKTAKKLSVRMAPSLCLKF